MIEIVIVFTQKKKRLHIHRFGACAGEKRSWEGLCLLATVAGSIKVDGRRVTPVNRFSLNLEAAREIFRGMLDGTLERRQYKGGPYCLSIEKQADENYRFSVSYKNIPVVFNLSMREKEMLCRAILDYMLT